MTKEQRSALQELAPYLRSIQKMVRTLGPDTLEEYCRYGYLSEAKVGELEVLEAQDGEGAEGEDDDV